MLAVMADSTDSLVRTSFTVMALLSQAAAAHDLSLTQLRVLAILRDREPKMAELADYLGLDRSSVSGLIDRAARRGFVRRDAGDDDGRAVRVSLTSDGHALAARLTDEVETMIAPMTRRLSAAERRRLGVLLDRMLDGRGQKPAAMARTVQRMTIPPTVDRLAPWLISRDTEAEIAFLAAAFDGVEKPGSRVMNGSAIGHVEVALAGASVLMFDAAPSWPATPAHLRIYVDDLDRTMSAALREGAVVVTEPTALPFGDVVARLRDPQGHRWWVHQHVEDVSVAEMTRRFADPATAAALAFVGDTLQAEMASRG